jgi:hypothetical protein
VLADHWVDVAVSVGALAWQGGKQEGGQGGWVGEESRRHAVTWERA